MNDTSKRFIPCQACGNEDISEVANFCIKCGQTLYNTCTNEDCGHTNPGAAYFCEKCGSYTNKLIISGVIEQKNPDELAMELKIF